eukprot:scaffold174330_cov18-Tisochrysis_lutea.AAC.1
MACKSMQSIRKHFGCIASGLRCGSLCDAVTPVKVCPDKSPAFSEHEFHDSVQWMKCGACHIVVASFLKELFLI